MTFTPPQISDLRRIIYYASFVLAMTVGALQMYGIKGGWITSYGADLFGPAWLYWMRMGTTPGRLYRKFFSQKPPGPARTAVVIFLLCLAWEVNQRFDWSGTPLAITRGTFDPMDIACYAVSLALCYLVDVRLGAQPIAGLDVPA